MEDHSFSEAVEDNSRDVWPSIAEAVIKKLPTINLKCFYGKPEKYHTFIDWLECVIDKNGTLAKWHFIVKGNDTIIILSVKLGNENYNICLNLPKEIYEDKQ